MAILKDLIVHGSSRFLNKIYASEIQTLLIDAETGIFKKLKADDATIVGLLDVQGQMHTNSWTNSNIATIDGSFYITPTLSSSSGTVSFSSATAATFTGTYSAVSSLYIGNDTASTVQWTSGSKILITGEVEVDGEWTPLGTLLGILNSTNPTTSMPIVNITDNRNNTSNILTNIYSLKSNDSLSYRNLKISLYQRADNSQYYPLGIYITALGQNGKTFLDIYGGVNELTTSYGGYANPNVRIGNLSGLPAITTAAGNFTPVGWGIYTTNGYFSGTIVSNTGVIGGWKLGANSLYNETSGLNDNTAGIYLGTDGIRNYLTSTQYVNITGGKIIAQGVDLTGEITASSGSIGGWNIGTDTNKSLYYGNQIPGATTTNLVLSPTSATNSNAIGGSATGLNWFLSAGKVFGVTTAGALYTISGKIGGFDIGTTYIKNTKTSYNETANNGVWVGTDGIGLGKGLFYVTNAGALTAKSGSIAGWSFNTSSLYKTNATPGYNTSTMVISTGTASTNNIGGGGTASKTWMISAGTGFGVTTTGALYCNDAHISGEITATSGRIGGINIINGDLDISSINIGNLDGASNYAQKTDVTQAIDNLQIGGRNLLKGSDVTNTSLTTSLLSGTSTQTIPSGTVITLSVQVDADNVVWSNSGNKRIGVTSSVVKDGGGNQYIEAWAAMTGRTGTGIDKTFDTSFHGRVKSTYILQGELPLDKAFNLHIQSVTSGTVSVSRPKLEIGNKATDWTPAPEDIQESINNAAMTATSYITYINANDGIKIHNAQDTLNYLQLNSTAISIYRNNIETLNISNNEIRIGKFSDNNVFIDNDSVDIRNGQNTLASFTGNNTKFYDIEQNREVASFGANGVRVGNEDEQHFIVDSESIQAINENGSSIFSVQSTGGTITTEIVVAKGGNSQPHTDWEVYLNGGSSVPQNTFYAKEYSLLIDIDNSINTFNSMTVSVNDGNFQNVPVVRTQYQNTTGMTVYSMHLVTLPPFNFQYGTETVYKYHVEGVYVSDKGNTYRYSSTIHIPYDGQRTITMDAVGGTLTQTSGSVSGDNTAVPYGGNSTIWGDIYSSLGYAKAPAMTFGTRGRAGTVAPLSVTIGEELYANNDNQLSIGRYNLNNDEFFPLAFAIGNGTSDNDRSNAFNVDWDGNTEVGGSLEVSNGITNYGNLTVGGNETLTGILTVNNNIKVKGRFLNSAGNPLFKIVTKTIDNISIGVNSGAYPSVAVNESGYTPIAISGVTLGSASSGGTTYGWCIVQSFGINGQTLNFYVGNWSTSSAAKIKITIKVLCIWTNAL